jgi:hypothetical protein
LDFIHPKEPASPLFQASAPNLLHIFQRTVGRPHGFSLSLEKIQCSPLTRHRIALRLHKKPTIQKQKKLRRLCTSLRCRCVRHPRAVYGTGNGRLPAERRPELLEYWYLMK